MVGLIAVAIEKVSQRALVVVLVKVVGSLLSSPSVPSLLSSLAVLGGRALLILLNSEKTCSPNSLDRLFQAPKISWSRISVQHVCIYEPANDSYIP